MLELEYRKIFLSLSIVVFCICLLHINIYWHFFKGKYLTDLGFASLVTPLGCPYALTPLSAALFVFSFFMFSLSSLIMMHLPCLLDKFSWWMLFHVISRSLTLDKTLGNKFLSACEFFYYYYFILYLKRSNLFHFP